MSFLENNYLADLMSDMGDELDADNATVALSPANGEQNPVSEFIQLPGGIVMKKKTFWILVGILASVAIYMYLQRNKKKTEAIEG